MDNNFVRLQSHYTKTEFFKEEDTIKQLNLAPGFLLVFVFFSVTGLFACQSPGSGPAGHKILRKAVQPDIGLEREPFNKHLAAVPLIAESSAGPIFIKKLEDKKGDTAPLLAMNSNIQTVPRLAKADAAAETGAKEQGDDDDLDDGFEEEFGEPSESQVSDPLSGYNRIMTAINDKFFFRIASGYGQVVPEKARLAVSRFFKNLFFPISFINNVLQLKIENAGKEALRFGINSTIGILGLWDPAKNWHNIEAHPEDFGQTLGYYGVGSGFHIVWPIVGPSNLRDTLGMVVGYFADPITYAPDYLLYQPANIDDAIEWSVRGFRGLNETSLHVDEYESLKKDAIDFYPFLRDVYEQNRNRKIKE